VAFINVPLKTLLVWIRD